VLSDDVAQCGLGDLIDRRVHVFDGHHRLSRINNPKVGQGGDVDTVDTHIVAGDDPLGLNRHRAMRIDTRHSRSMTRMINLNPGSRTAMTRPKRK